MSRSLPNDSEAGHQRRLLLRSSEGATPAAHLRMRRRHLVYAGRGEACGMWLQGVCVVPVVHTRTHPDT